MKKRSGVFFLTVSLTCLFLYQPPIFTSAKEVPLLSVHSTSTNIKINNSVIDTLIKVAIEFKVLKNQNSKALQELEKQQQLIKTNLCHTQEK